MQPSPMPALVPLPRATLLVDDRGAILWSEDGACLVELPPLEGHGEAYRRNLESLRPHLAPGAQVRMALGHSALAIQCLDVPFLGGGEQREVAERTAAGLMGPVTFQTGWSLLPDPGAEGGHQLWVAAQPSHLMDDWVRILGQLRVELRQAVPLPFLLLGEAEPLAEQGRDRLLVALDRDIGRAYFFRGAGLAFTRTFRLPEGVDPDHLDEGGEELLAELLVEEAGRVLQFIKQKHRGVGLTTVTLMGLPDLPGAWVAALERALRLKVLLVGGSLAALLARAFGGDSHRKGALNLVPEEVLEARRIRLLRATTWGAAAALVALGIGVWASLRVVEGRLAMEAQRAESARDQRQRLWEASQVAARERFPLLRVRMAEHRQAEAVSRLEALGMRLLEVPEGVVLEEVEVLQMPGDALRHRFRVSGTALSQGHLSVGPMAQYMAWLQGFSGLQLQPLQDVSISDRVTEGGGRNGPDQRAVTRFTLMGEAP